MGLRRLDKHIVEYKLNLAALIDSEQMLLSIDTCIYLSI